MIKGIVFTFDAALAAVLAVVLLAVVVSLQPTNTGTYYGKLQLASIGNDFLAVLDQNSTFDSYMGGGPVDPTADLQGYLATLPPNYCASVSVLAFSYLGGGFSADSHTFTVTRIGCTSSTADVVEVKRVFISNSPEIYGRVDMVLWLK